MKKTITVMMLSACAALFSCTKGFEDMNRNPNQLSEINPEYLFNTSVYETLDATCGAIKKNLLDNYVQYNYGQTNQMGRYGDITSTNGNYYKAFYNNALLPLHLIVEDKADEPEFANRVAIAEIWQAYVFSQVTSIWGPIPMSEALTGKTAIPYDDEPTIYRNILSTLKRCAESIDLDGDKFNKDPVFARNDKSDLEKWVKFANSLRLRIALRICNADRSLAQEHISDVMANENKLMTSNDDNCIVKWGDNTSTQNYYYDYFIIQSSNSDKANAAGEAFLMHTAPYHDPRLPKFFTECTSAIMPADFHWAPYWGIPKTDRAPVSGLLDSSNPYSGAMPMQFSLMHDSYFAQDYAQTFLSFAEVCLLKSELIHLGLGTGSKSAEAYYQAGIRASMAQFGVTDTAAIDEYYSTDGIEWGICSDLENPEGEAYFMDYLKLCSAAIKDTEEDPIYHQIIMQQYIAMFNQGLDAWTLLRRSQVLDMPPHYNPETGYGAVNAGSSDVTFAYIPMRLPYPSNELADNTEEVNKAVADYLGGNDKMDTRLWWAKPQLINQRLKQLVDNYNRN